ncbi:LuxR C-terminal-related transcriptional regulator [Nocardia sp. NPDC050193]
MRNTQATVAPPTSSDFVGRQPELERVGALITDSAGLVTLIGSGGIGKTHLALEVVHRVHETVRFPVHWTRLARLQRGAGATEVEDEIVRSVVEVDFSGRPARQVLFDTLTRTDTAAYPLPPVLVLDNCEHVLDGVAAVVGELLTTVPGLRILATSREPIGWADERLVAVPPLSRSQALDLFRRRADAVGVALGAGGIETAEQICRHLHYHPLSLRLAAARLRHQPLTTVLREVSGEPADRRLRWAPTSRTGAPERHGGIGNVIGWSYDLCEPDEQLLFERLSVFAAGYDLNPEDATGSVFREAGVDLEAVVAVCADPGPGGLLEEDIEPLLERLVDRSLVSIHLGTDTARYSLLENFRIFARRQLHQRDPAEAARLAGRHRRYYREKVARARVAWLSSVEQDLLRWARGAWDNLLCAVESSLDEPGEASIGLDIAGGMIALRLPFFIGTLREARTLAERALTATRVPGRPLTEPQIAVTALVGWMSLCQGLPREAEVLLEECVAAAVTDPALRSASAADPDTDLGLPAEAEYLWGSILLLEHGDIRATTVLARAREKFLAAGDPGGASMSRLFEALAAAFHGTAESALAVTGAHFDYAVATGAEWVLSWAELARAIAAAAHGDPIEAAAAANAALTRQVAMEEHWGTTWGVHIRTWILARMISDGAPGARDMATEIALLSGGAATLRRQIGVDLEPLRPFAARTEQAVDTARTVLGAGAFDTAFRTGAALDAAGGDIVRLALGTLPRAELPPSEVARPHGPVLWQHLSTAERDIAVLAAAGWTNAAIAARRGSSQRTVDAQVAAVLQKLGIRSRTGIAGALPENQQARVRLEKDRKPRRR